MVATQHGSFVFRIDPKLLQHRPPRLTLAATLDALGNRVQSHDLDANVVVDILDEKQLLPYIIGNIKNLHIVSLGQITNASKIGDIIVSEETIKGTYELCLAFLRFVLNIIKSESYVDRSYTMLASVTYIANEVYSNHHIWTYKNSTDMHEILGLCTEIFHHIIVIKTTATTMGSKKPIKKPCPASPPREQPSELEIVCVINLSQNQAHKQLLSVIVEGRQLVNDVISENDFDGEQSLRTKPVVQRIRQSLEIFGKLLTRSEYIKNYYESRNIITGQNLDGSTTNYYSVPMTNIERALFDTSMRPGLLQHLFGYIYQVEDFTTACLVMNLIKKIAEKFSMSLMASLDSEADRVCAFFIDCLGRKDSNTDMKIAIVDLLTTCVRHQPGLIESFLNHKNTESKNTNDNSAHPNSLQVLMDLIKECLSQQNDIHRSLHAYVMKFFLTFWQKCHSAIEQFDRVDEFWDLITRPLMKFLDSTGSIPSQVPYTLSQTLDDKLVSYVLMIFAREIFNINVSATNERKLNPKLREKMDELAGKNLVPKYSTFILKRFKNIPTNMERGQDYTRILTGWRDFLASHTKYKPFDIGQTVKIQLIENILACLAVELKLGENLDRERLATIGEMLLLTWINWREDVLANDVIFEFIHELLYLVDVCKDYVPFSFLLTFQSIVNMYLMRARDYLVNSTRSFDLLVPSMELMHFSLKIMETFIIKPGDKHHSPNHSEVAIESKPGVESRLCYASITSLRFIIDIARPHIDLWIGYLQKNLKTDSLIQFATMLIERQADPDVSLAMVELLACVSLLSQTAYYLNRSRLLPLLERFLAKKEDHPGWTSEAVKQMQMIKKIISSSLVLNQYSTINRQK